MTTKTQSGESRQRDSQQYKPESLALAEQLGVAAAARQLGLHESQLGITGEKVLVFHKIRTPWENGFW